MEVLVDGKPFAGELAGASLQELLEDLCARAMDQSESLREVRVNGAQFDAQSLGPADQLPASRVERLEVDTIPVREMAVHFLSNAEAYLHAIDQGVGRVAELFRVSDEQEASEQYLMVLESLQLFVQMLSGCRDVLELDFEAADHNGVTISQHLDRLAALVRDLLSAQEQEDWVLLADVLQYDLAAELKTWRGLIPGLKEQALS
jgi:hypothetical protein